jgi:hypothetical protein
VYPAAGLNATNGQPVTCSTAGKVMLRAVQAGGYGLSASGGTGTLPSTLSLDPAGWVALVLLTLGLCVFHTPPTGRAGCVWLSVSGTRQWGSVIGPCMAGTCLVLFGLDLVFALPWWQGLWALSMRRQLGVALQPVIGRYRAGDLCAVDWGLACVTGGGGGGGVAVSSGRGAVPGS